MRRQPLRCRISPSWKNLNGNAIYGMEMVSDEQYQVELMTE